MAPQGSGASRPLSCRMAAHQIQQVRVAVLWYCAVPRCLISTKIQQQKLQTLIFLSHVQACAVWRYVSRP